jgi:hypothetical protein
MNERRHTIHCSCVPKLVASCERLTGERDAAAREVEPLKAEVQSLRVELEQTKATLEFSREWWASRSKRLRELADRHGLTTQHCEIVANGTPAGEQPTYEQILNTTKHQLEAALARVAMLRDALDRDQTGLAAALQKIRDHVRGHSWLLDGRGSYEWDDDRYREEAGHAMRPVIEIAAKALSDSGTIANRSLHDVDKAARDFMHRHNAIAFDAGREAARK